MTSFTLPEVALPLPIPTCPKMSRRIMRRLPTSISSHPRGAAALLRLAIQKLCADLGEKGKNINADIASLVAKGLPATVQQALDVVRVTGNNAVHPGQIITDEAGVAEALFPLVNIIVEYMISIPSRVNSLYENLPEGAKAAIAKRDGTTPPTAT